MDLILFDRDDALPVDRGEHIYVYTGPGDDPDGTIVTYADCIYMVGDNQVRFRKNADPEAMRFEGALKWALVQSNAVGIERIFAVFAVSRRIDMHRLRSTYAVRVIDNRTMPDDDRINRQRASTPPAWRALRPAVGSKLRRTAMSGF